MNPASLLAPQPSSRPWERFQRLRARLQANPGLLDEVPFKLEVLALLSHAETRPGMTHMLHATVPARARQFLHTACAILGVPAPHEVPRDAT
jgi:hypothetical protein